MTATTLEFPMKSPARPSAAAAKPKPAVIIVGLDDRAKAHASWFAVPNAASAREAAKAMTMHAIDVINDDLRALAQMLPEGRLFDSGRAFVPFVKRETYDRLVSHLSKDAVAQLDEAKRAAAEALIAAAGGADDEAPAPISPSSLPADWPKIRVSSVVLALDPDGGWWEATVNEDKGDGLLALTWLDYDQPPFLRRREQLALLPQGHRAA